MSPKRTISPVFLRPRPIFSSGPAQPEVNVAAAASKARSAKAFRIKFIVLQRQVTPDFFWCKGFCFAGTSDALFQSWWYGFLLPGPPLRDNAQSYSPEIVNKTSPVCHNRVTDVYDSKAGFKELLATIL
jgi:hypothetical protein